MSQQRNKKTYRKKVPDATEKEEIVPQNEVDVSLKLLQTKELQKLRGRSKGVNAGVGIELNLPPSITQEAPQRSLNSNFTTQQDKPEINQHLEKYIEEKMKNKEPSADGTNTEKDKLASSDDLYTTPDHLKGPEPKANSDTTNWLTGIVEVQLPMEYKLKNIEETEKAKRELLQHEQPVSRPTFGEANLYGSSFANIRYQTERQTKRMETAVGSERATDDIVMDRFKKRFRK